MFEPVVSLKCPHLDESRERCRFQTYQKQTRQVVQKDMQTTTQQPLDATTFPLNRHMQQWLLKTPQWTPTLHFTLYALHLHLALYTPYSKLHTQSTLHAATRKDILDLQNQWLCSNRDSDVSTAIWTALHAEAQRSATPPRELTFHNFKAMLFAIMAVSTAAKRWEICATLHAWVPRSATKCHEVPRSATKCHEVPREMTFQNFKTRRFVALAIDTTPRGIDLASCNTLRAWLPRNVTSAMRNGMSNLQNETFCCNRHRHGDDAIWRPVWYTSQQIATKCSATRSNISNLQNGTFCNNRHGEGSIYGAAQHVTP